MKTSKTNSQPKHVRGDKVRFMMPVIVRNHVNGKTIGTVPAGSFGNYRCLNNIRNGVRFYDIYPQEVHDESKDAGCVGYVTVTDAEIEFLPK